MKEKGEIKAPRRKDKSSELSDLESALKRKALGYSTEETVEEYGVTEGSLELTRRKVTRKEVPPDLSAIKAYMELKGADEYSQKSLDELFEEREKLLLELKNYRKKE